MNLDFIGEMMLISEMSLQLQALKDKHGDIRVMRLLNTLDGVYLENVTYIFDYPVALANPGMKESDEIIVAITGPQ